MSGQHRRGPAHRTVAGGRRKAVRAGRRRLPERNRPAKRDVGGRVIAVLGLVGAAVIGLGGQGTYAYWTDMDGVSGGSFSSGTLDLTVDGVQGNPASYVKTNLALGSMVPGESVAATLALANPGSVDFTWTATVATGGGLGPALQVQMYSNSTQTGDDTTYPRTEACSSTTAPVTSGTTSTRLNQGATHNLCVRVTLPTSTGDAFQNQTTGSVSVTINATQVLS
jgi:alternate signal-mediated exported protein